MSTTTKPMTILEHIRAGHYPVDEKNRPLVPTTCDDTLTVLATDKPGEYPIVGWTGMGWIGSWAADSRFLRPPPPRKVKIRAWGVIARRPTSLVFACLSEAEARKWGCNGQPVIELTGEYEEPWSAADAKGEEGLPSPPSS